MMAQSCFGMEVPARLPDAPPSPTSISDSNKGRVVPRPKKKLNSKSSLLEACKQQDRDASRDAANGELQTLYAREEQLQLDVRLLKSEFEVSQQVSLEASRRTDAIEENFENLSSLCSEMCRRIDVLESLFLNSSEVLAEAPSRSEHADREGSHDSIQIVTASHLIRLRSTEHVVESDPGHTMAKTVWETPLMLGSGLCDVTTSVTIFLALAMNAVMQFLFSVVAWRNFLDENFPNTDEVEFYRYSVGHQVSWSGSTLFSLAEKVCAGERSLTLAKDQRDLVQDGDRDTFC